MNPYTPRTGLRWNPDIECEHRFDGGFRCGAKPEHPVHIYNKWPGPEPYHLFIESRDEPAELDGHGHSPEDCPDRAA